MSSAKERLLQRREQFRQQRGQTEQARNAMLNPRIENTPTQQIQGQSDSILAGTPGNGTYNWLPYMMTGEFGVPPQSSLGDKSMYLAPADTPPSILRTLPPDVIKNTPFMGFKIPFDKVSPEQADYLMNEIVKYKTFKEKRAEEQIRNDPRMLQKLMGGI
jgi:hypothetical protein